MPYDELKEFNNVPDMFKTQQYEVNSKTPYKAKGVTAYKSISKSFTMILPVNSIVNPNSENDIFDKSLTHWAKNTQFKKVIFTHPDSGLVYDDLYVDLNSDQFEKINDNMYRVVGNGQTGKCWDYENLRSTPTYNKEKPDENFVMQVPNKSKFTIEKKSGNYYKIKTLNGKQQDGYIYAKSCKEDGFVLDFDENNLDEIITGNDCNIPVKAGDIIGFTGPMGHIGNEQHRTTHLEVFSASDPTAFLKGKEGDKDDIADTKDYIKIAKGAMLSHHYPYTLKTGDEILVLQVEEEYSRIKLHKQYRTVEKSDLCNGTAPTEETGNYTYTNFKLDKINEAFDGTITKDSVITLNEDAEQIAKEQTSRDVSYSLPNGEHCYWVHKDHLPSGVTMMGQYFTLNSDINQLFESKPNKNYVSTFFPNDSEKQTELMGDYIISKKEVKEIKLGNVIWYEIKLQDCRGERKGYIKSDDEKVSKVSAHDWTAFGFKVLKDQPDNFIFDETEKNAPQFLKSVFKEMDTDGNKKLSPQELRRGLNDMYVCERLSKLVCYHQNEWGVNYSSLKQELETLFDKGIEQEEDEEIKEHFIKQKENSLKVIEDKVNALDFWSKVKVPGNEMPEGWTYDPTLDKSRKMYSWETQSNPQPRGKGELEPFPTDTKVYHFHPNAFVEQMRRVNNCVIEIVRKWTYWSGENSSSATISTFSVSNSNISGYITEPYGPDTTQKNKDKRIPIGEYKLTWHVSNKFSKDKYVNSTNSYISSLDDPCLNYGFPKLYNESVAKSRGILIHIGVRGEHSEGCLLPGKEKLTSNIGGKQTIIGVKESPEQFYTLIAFLEEVGIQNVKLIIKEDYEQQ